MEILYRPEKQNVRADALSRREQDLPSNTEDERLQKRIVQVLKPTITCYEDTAEESAELTFVISTRIRTRPAVVRKVAIKEQSEPRDRSAQKGTHEIENL
jgi:hypothetical protein